MNNHVILGVHITNRAQKAPRVQEILTGHGCIIRTRLGLHEAREDACGPSGLLVLEVLDDMEKVEALDADLRGIDGVEVQKMVFTHG
jgi:hypothetical protein